MIRSKGLDPIIDQIEEAIDTPRRLILPNRLIKGIDPDKIHHDSLDQIELLFPSWM